MAVREVFSLLTAIVVLAGIAVAITRGDQTAHVLDASANGFGNVIRAATLQKG
jgi:hypothetical protein